VTSVTVPPAPDSYTNAPKGDIFVEFDVPASAVRSLPGGWGKIYGPNSMFGEALGIKEMPAAENIIEVLP